MPRSKNQRGSAVIEFVLLGAPTLLLFSSGFGVFINSYVDTVLRSIAIDASRFAALADQNSSSATVYLQEKLHRLLPNVKVSQRVDRDSVAFASLEYRPLPSIFDLTTTSVEIRAVSPIEK